MKKSFFTCLLFLLLTVVGLGQEMKVEPPFWWADMPTDELQLMIYAEDIGYYTASTSTQNVVIQRQLSGDSKNYKFLYIDLEGAKPGSIEFTLSYGKKKRNLVYELKSRDNTPNKNQGFNSSDVIYLLMPDRFANGNTDNDSVEGMLEKVDRSNPNGRHGGDIKGIRDNLDYIKSLGMTAVWLTPVFENDMTAAYGAYHGYAATDLYQIDRRYGSNDEFKDFVAYCHENDVKVIMDMIHNHIGDQHWWMSDLPTKDWVHDLEKYGTTSYRALVQSDPYASDYDLAKLERGWFVNEMPDLNQRSPLLADYLIQNTIWWIEYSGIDGIRMDTYVYPYREYMARWVKEVLDAYPQFNIVGEAWVESVTHEAYWQRDIQGQEDGYNSYLPNVTDFQVQKAIASAMNQEKGWMTGMMQLYLVLSQDRLYSNPLENVIFLDNHDLERFFTQIGEDEDFFKMSYAYLMTTRGIPQVYYGTELMMANANTEGDSRKRADMPGGWASDERTVFNSTGRTAKENDIVNYVSTITNWRKNATAVHNGALRHFIVEDEVYVYFRYNSEQTVMVVMNKNEGSQNIATSRFKEILSNFSKATNIINGNSIDITEMISVPGKTTSIFELTK